MTSSTGAAEEAPSWDDAASSRAPTSPPIPSSAPDMSSRPDPSPLERVLQRGRLRAASVMLGPAFVAAAAYVDPGNFATNVQGGAQFGYLLLWVVLVANLMAMVVQYLSAKLGIATGGDLAELCGIRFPRAVNWGLWLQAEAVAMSTDVAEFIGAALGLNLLFGVPLLPAGALTAVVAFGVLALQSRGYRRFELAITGLLAIVLAGFLYQTLRIGPSVRGSLAGLLPRVDGADSVLLAVGIVGATVMPHAIYLHSALTKDRMPCRDDEERSQVRRFARLDVLVALSIAGAVNMAMLAVAAKLFHGPGRSVDSIEEAHLGFATLVGGSAAVAFAAALPASGLASSSVGTYAGQVVSRGFVGLSMPIMVRRGVTMLPALVVLALGVDLTRALVLSQVVLSFGIPFALVPLIVLTRDRQLMGEHVNHRATTAAAVVIATVVVGLNVFLIVQQLHG